MRNLVHYQFLMLVLLVGFIINCEPLVDKFEDDETGIDYTAKT